MNEEDEEITFIEPVYAPWDGRRVPVVLLGGYLGAGRPRSSTKCSPAQTCQSPSW